MVLECAQMKRISILSILHVFAYQNLDGRCGQFPASFDNEVFTYFPICIYLSHLESYSIDM